MKSLGNTERSLYHEDRRKRGLCIWCDNPLSPQSRSLCEKHREQQRERNVKWRRDLKRKVLNAYGGKCGCCGETMMEFLTIDHIGGNGRKHRQSIGGDAYFYRWLETSEFPEGYRVLCYNCNSAFGHFGYCPHQTINQGVNNGKV